MSDLEIGTSVPKIYREPVYADKTAQITTALGFMKAEFDDDTGAPKFDDAKWLEATVTQDFTSYKWQQDVRNKVPRENPKFGTKTLSGNGDTATIDPSGNLVTTDLSENEGVLVRYIRFRVSDIRSLRRELLRVNLDLGQYLFYKSTPMAALVGFVMLTETTAKPVVSDSNGNFTKNCKSIKAYFPGVPIEINMDDLSRITTSGCDVWVMTGVKVIAKGTTTNSFVSDAKCNVLFDFKNHAEDLASLAMAAALGTAVNVGILSTGVDVTSLVRDTIERELEKIPLAKTMLNRVGITALDIAIQFGLGMTLTALNDPSFDVLDYIRSQLIFIVDDMLKLIAQMGFIGASQYLIDNVLSLALGTTKADLAVKAVGGNFAKNFLIAWAFLGYSLTINRVIYW